MSLIQHSYFPRTMFEPDYWLQPSTLGNLGLGGGFGFPTTPLDIFDPFDELDRLMSRNLSWLNVPEMFSGLPVPAVPKVPKKFRITADTRGFSANSIKTEFSDDKSKLVISAKEGESKKETNEDYTLREFRRTYNIPKNAETDKLVSFVASNGKLVVEIPLKEEEETGEKKDELFPRIVEAEGGKKHLEMNLSLPESIDPSKIRVTCKDHDLIVQAEDRQEKPDSFSQISYYRRTTLPETTDFKNLKCTFDNNKLSLQAPINPELERTRAIAIDIHRPQKIEQAPSQQGEKATEQVKQPSEKIEHAYEKVEKPTEKIQPSQPSEQKTSETAQPSEKHQEYQQQYQQQQKSQYEQQQQQQPPQEQQQQQPVGQYQQPAAEIKQAEVSQEGKPKEKGHGDIPIENIQVERER